MISANAAMTGSYDYGGDVARSMLIAIIASYAAFDLAGRITAVSGRARAAWLTASALAISVGICATHFKGMLALRPPAWVENHWPTVLVSLVLTVIASAIALFVVGRQEMSPVRTWTASVVMGGGITAMYYVDIAAMRLSGAAHFASFPVALSIVLAIGFSSAAFSLAFSLRTETKARALRRIGSAVVMGIAISVMCYGGVAAATFIPSTDPPNLSHAVTISWIGDNGVLIATFLILGAAIVTSSVDRQTQAKTRRLNESLEQRVIERTKQLTAVNEALRGEIAERQRAEDALRQSEDRVRLIIDTIPTMTWSMRPDDTLDFVNQRWLDYTGLTLEEELEQPTRAVHPEDLPRIIEKWHADMAAGEPCEDEMRLQRADGEYRWFLVRTAPLRDERGTIVKWYGVATDIEDRKRAESQSRMLLDAIPVQIWSGPPDGTLDYCNERWRCYMGLRLDELQGDGWQSMLHSDDRERVLKAWHDSVTNGTSYEQEERHRGADGQYRWFLSRGVPLRDSERRILRWYGTNTDIEDRKEAEERLRLVVDTTPALLHSARPDGYVDFFNTRYLEYLGLSLAKVSGWGWTESIHPEDLDMVSKWRLSLATGEPFEAEARVRRADGEYRRLLHRKVPLRDQAGNIVGWYGSSIDIEDRKRAEAALQKAQAELDRVTRLTTMGELAAAIAHEVNQPLTAIVTNADFCMRQLAGAAPHIGDLREAIAEILNDGARASAVISRIRVLLRKSVPERIELDINRIIEEVTVLLRDELMRNLVSWRTDLAPDLPHVFGDRVQLQQVLINLVMNGIEAMRSISRRPRELLIKSAKIHDELSIQVQDSGTGLDPEQAGQIFEPFFTTKPEGIGMGLSISRSIVESHGGRLWAESGPKGALFQFTLPAQ
jgi:PAS domain S-box-containing protein